MAETLVTQYAGTVDNDNLPKLGELRFSITPAQNTNVRYNLLELSTKEGEGDVVVSVIGNGYITDANRTANLGTSKTIAAGANMDKTYFSNGTFTVVVSNKYAITALVGGTGASGSCNYKNWSFDIEQLRGMSNLTNLQFHTSGFYGDIISLSSLTNLESFYADWLNDANIEIILDWWPNIYDFHASEVSGDIAAFSNRYNLRYINGANSPNLFGDISSLTNLPIIRVIELGGVIRRNTKITGDISSLANLNRQTLIDIRCDCPNVYGNINAFAGYTNLRSLIVNIPHKPGRCSYMGLLSYR